MSLMLPIGGGCQRAHLARRAPPSPHRACTNTSASPLPTPGRHRGATGLELLRPSRPRRPVRPERRPPSRRSPRPPAEPCPGAPTARTTDPPALLRPPPTARPRRPGLTGSTSLTAAQSSDTACPFGCGYPCVLGYRGPMAGIEPLDEERKHRCRRRPPARYACESPAVARGTRHARTVADAGHAERYTRRASPSGSKTHRRSSRWRCCPSAATDPPFPADEHPRVGTESLMLV